MIASAVPAASAAQQNGAQAIPKAGGLSMLGLNEIMTSHWWVLQAAWAEGFLPARGHCSEGGGDGMEREPIQVRMLLRLIQKALSAISMGESEASRCFLSIGSRCTNANTQQVIHTASSKVVTAKLPHN